MRFLGRFAKALGVIGIVLFCALSIMFSLIARDVAHQETQELLSYASSLENKFYDFRMKKVLEFDPEKKDQDLVLVKVDDESLQKINSWPIPRDNWVKVLDHLKSFGAKMVAFDVFFPEKANACSGENPDAGFAKAIENFQSIDGNKVIMAYTTQSNKQTSVFEEVPDDLFNFIMDSKQAGETGLERRYVETGTYPIQDPIGPHARSWPISICLKTVTVSSDTIKWWPMLMSSTFQASL